MLLTFLFSSHTSAQRLNTFDSKYPLFSAGTVLPLVCHPILTRWLLVNLMCIRKELALGKVKSGEGGKHVG